MLIRHYFRCCHYFLIADAARLLPPRLLRHAYAVDAADYAATVYCRHFPPSCCRHFLRRHYHTTFHMLPYACHTLLLLMIRHTFAAIYFSLIFAAAMPPPLFSAATLPLYAAFFFIAAITLRCLRHYDTLIFRCFAAAFRHYFHYAADVAVACSHDILPYYYFAVAVDIDVAAA